MKDFTFAVDIDEVVRNIVKEMLTVYNREFNENWVDSDVTIYDVDKCFPRIQQELGISAAEYFFVKHSEEVFLGSSIIDGAYEAINTLRKYGKVIFVTYQKDRKSITYALDWLSTFNIPFDGIFFTKDKSLISADYLIDDCVKNFKGCKCRHGILISRPYNIQEDLSDVRKYTTMDRFSSLKAFSDWFENNISIAEKFM